MFLILSDLKILWKKAINSHFSDFKVCISSKTGRTCTQIILIIMVGMTYLASINAEILSLRYTQPCMLFLDLNTMLTCLPLILSFYKV